MLNIYSPIFLIFISILSILILITIVSKIECLCTKFKFYTIKNTKVLKHTRIIYVSDFHDKVLKDSGKIINRINDLMPDFILLGGDFIDFSSVSSIFGKYKYSNSLKFLKRVSEIIYNKENKNNVNKYRIFFSFGNHELRLKDKKEIIFQDFCKNLEELKIKILDNDKCLVDKDICISGISLYNGYYGKWNVQYSISSSAINSCISDIDQSKFNIVMFHKPDYAFDFINYGFDLVLSGHNHGGLIKLKGNKALLSPDFKLFPRFNYGHYCFNGKNIIVSNGLGEHFVKIRVNNIPEIVVIDIN